MLNLFLRHVKDVLRSSPFWWLLQNELVVQAKETARENTTDCKSFPVVVDLHLSGRGVLKEPYFIE